MNAPDDNTGKRSFREWWRNPPRSGLQRIINPWEYRHLGFCGAARIAGGTVAAADRETAASGGVLWLRPPS